MSEDNLSELLYNKKKKIVLAPHYDDLAFSLGGLALNLSNKKCKVEEWVIFSNSNYLFNDNNGNKDVSENRIQKVSKIRLNEELNALRKLGNVKIKVCDQDEALLRGYKTRTRDHIFPYGLDKKADGIATKNIEKIIKPLLNKDVQIFAPLSIKEHVDHIIVRNTLTNLIKDNKKRKAKIFFYEDLPYATYVNDQERSKVSAFIKERNLKTIIIPINLKLKLRLLKFYKSQIGRSYSYYYNYYAIWKRAKKIQMQEREKLPCEKLYITLPEVRK